MTLQDVIDDMKKILVNWKWQQLNIAAWSVTSVNTSMCWQEITTPIWFSVDAFIDAGLRIMHAMLHGFWLHFVEKVNAELHNKQR